MQYSTCTVHNTAPPSFAAVALWFAAQAALHLLLPGPRIEGVPLPDGRRLRYKLTGFRNLLATLARVAADLSDTYFDHLGWAAGLWLVGSAVWLAFLGPKLLGWRR